MGPNGPTVAAEGCSPAQELEKAARRAAIFLVVLIYQTDIYHTQTYVYSNTSGINCHF